MTKLASYYLPGLYVEDHAIDVPLDWRGLEPARLAADRNARSAGPEATRRAPIAGAPETIRLFYRTVCAPENAHRDLPLLVFLQGGPGGQGPRLTSPASDGWVAEAVKRFRVVLPDQRGTGRSTRVSRHMTERVPGARAQADYLKRFLARSIVRDFEYLRLTEFDGRPWTTLGQSYGGFLTLTYLSFYPEGVSASFTCGGIPHVPASAREVYAHTFPRMARKTAQFYERYPEDEARVSALADRLAKGDVRLADGAPMTVCRLQFMGSDFGMKPSFERMHNILDTAFEEGDGRLSRARTPRASPSPTRSSPPRSAAPPRRRIRFTGPFRNSSTPTASWRSPSAGPPRASMGAVPSSSPRRARSCSRARRCSPGCLPRTRCSRPSPRPWTC